MWSSLPGRKETQASSEKAGKEISKQSQKTNQQINEQNSCRKGLLFDSEKPQRTTQIKYSPLPPAKAVIATRTDANFFIALPLLVEYSEDIHPIKAKLILNRSGSPQEKAAPARELSLTSLTAAGRKTHSCLCHWSSETLLLSTCK